VSTVVNGDVDAMEKVRSLCHRSPGTRRNSEDDVVGAFHGQVHVHVLYLNYDVGR
jgi:hypothetical protein